MPASTCRPHARRLLISAALAVLMLAALALSPAPALGQEPITAYTVTALAANQPFMYALEGQVTVTITNTGQTWLTKLPLHYVYDTHYLSFGRCGQSNTAVPPVDDQADDGRLDWTDLTAAGSFGSDLAPGASATVHFTLVGAADTYVLPNWRTVTTATVTGGLADPDGDGPLPAEPLPERSSRVDIMVVTPTCASSGPDCTPSVSGKVWHDVDFDGGYNTAPESGIAGVALSLYVDDGDNVYEPGTGDAPYSTALSAGGEPLTEAGAYSLRAPAPQVCSPSTSVWVSVDAGNLAPGGPLQGMTLTSAAPYGPNPTEVLLVGYGGRQDASFGYSVVGSYRVRVPSDPPPVGVHKPVSVTLTIENTGTSTLTALPFTATYDKAYLSYFGSWPASDDVANDGQLTWRDLLAGGRLDAGGLAPGQTLTVVLNFAGAQDTTELPDHATTVAGWSAAAYADPDGAGPLEPLGPLPVNQGTAQVSVYVPGAVELAGVRVERSAGGVTLAWETADESRILGFNVLRGDGANQEPLNAELILADYVGLNRGAAYRFADESSGASTARYALEVVYLDGRTELHEVR